MARNVKISVIIPTLNEEKLVEHAIASVADADQVVVVDGGSTDQSAAVAHSAGATVIHTRAGRGGQLRTGVSKATGDVYLLLHADSRLSELALCELRQLASRTKRIYGCFRQSIDDPRYRYRLLEYGNALRATWLSLPYGDQAVFIDRQTYDLVGGMDDVPLMEDVMFAKKLRSVGRPTLLAGPVHLSARRWHRRGVLRQTLKNWSILTAFWLGVPPVRLARWYR